MAMCFSASERAACRPLLRLAKLADKNPARLATLLGQPPRLYNNKSGKTQQVDPGEWAFVGKAIYELSGGATEYSLPRADRDRAVKIIRDHLAYLQQLRVPIIPEVAELVRRLQQAATLAIHLRAAQPDWSECLDSVISSSFAAPMDSLELEECKELQGLEVHRVNEEPRVGDLLISHPVWSVLQAPFDFSLILIVATDALRGVTGLRINQADDQTVAQFLASCDEELPVQLQHWMLQEKLQQGGPLMSYSEVESLYWITGGESEAPHFCGDLQNLNAESTSLRFFRGCAKWSWDQLSVDLERGLWVHARAGAQSLHKICFDTLATRDVWHAAMQAAVGPVLADLPRGPAADPILKQALVNHYRAQATDIAKQLFGPRSAEWERKLEAAKLCKAK